MPKSALITRTYMHTRGGSNFAVVQFPPGDGQPKGGRFKCGTLPYPPPFHSLSLFLSPSRRRRWKTRNLSAEEFQLCVIYFWMSYENSSSSIGWDYPRWSGTIRTARSIIRPASPVKIHTISNTSHSFPILYIVTISAFNHSPGFSRLPVVP